MQQPSIKIKRITFIVFVFVALFLVYLVVLSISRAGETKVKISVLPAKSEIFINDKKTKSKTVYLGDGKYTFSAKFEGYSTDSTVVEIKPDDTNIEVILLPEPSTDQTINELEKNTKLQSEREALGGKKNILEGEKISEKNPFVSQLPYIDIMGPFSVDYDLTNTIDGKLTLLISDSSPKGRQNALKWIRSQGVDPTDFNIVFEDFVNPLSPKEDND